MAWVRSLFWGTIMLKLDHFAFGCADLESAIIELSQVLGALPIVRARHQLFGTHNALWRLETSDAPVYLELIAIDPAAEQPIRKRWFGLDDPKVQIRFKSGPKLLTFVINSDDILMARKNAPVDPGAPVTVTRNDLKWQFSLHGDGRLVGDGGLPYIIEWAPGPRPVDNMTPQNIELIGMGGKRLDELGMDFPCEIFPSTARLEMKLKRPDGTQISLSSQD